MILNPAVLAQAAFQGAIGAGHVLVDANLHLSVVSLAAAVGAVPRGLQRAVGVLLDGLASGEQGGEVEGVQRQLVLLVLHPSCGFTVQGALHVV